MTKKVYDESYINNIALAIQEVSGTSDKYYVYQMADAILNLGNGGDSILNNAAADAVVDLSTKVTSISAFKMYKAIALETVTGVNLESLGYNAFTDANNLYSVKGKQALAINKETFRGCGKLYKICPENINYVGVEVCFKKDDAPVADKAFIEKMHRDNILVWANAIIFDYRQQLSGGHSDDSSLCISEDYGWGWLADRGYDLIQTDWPMMLIDYLKRTQRYYR